MKLRYVYRAIDQFGDVIDVYLSQRRDTAAARCFFTRALNTTQPTTLRVVAAFTDLAVAI